jgi:hypothetical protein
VLKADAAKDLTMAVEAVAVFAARAGVGGWKFFPNASTPNPKKFHITAYNLR